MSSEQDVTSVVALLERAVTIAEQATHTQAEIVKTQRRDRRTKRLLIISVSLDIALSIATGLLGLSQVSASNAIRQSQLNGCAIGNTLRANQIHLWDHVFALSTPDHETEAQRKKRLATEATFGAYIRSQFAPVDCTKLYGR